MGNSTDEINDFNKRIREFNITIKQLIKNSPRNKNHKSLAIDVAILVSDKREYLHYLLDNKRLPIKSIAAEMKIAPKFIRKYQPYIISICILRTNGYQTINSFINSQEE